MKLKSVFTRLRILVADEGKVIQDGDYSYCSQMYLPPKAKISEFKEVSKDWMEQWIKYKRGKINEEDITADKDEVTLSDDAKDGDGNLIEETSLGYYGYLKGLPMVDVCYMRAGKVAVTAGKEYTLDINGLESVDVMMLRWNGDDYVGYGTVQTGTVTIPDDCDTVAFNVRIGASVLAKLKDLTLVDGDDATAIVFKASESEE